MDIRTVRAAELRDTVEDMLSEDHRDRLRAEFDQVRIRIRKLDHMIVQLELGDADFVPDSPLYLLRKQRNTMIEYMRLLRERANIEGVAL